ncbi:TIR domain-containing adapter molecule 1 [Rhinatrema bivittatum]|uniref:TIR domain-containing adapter molecule 1 n=1 Tax=Rhinatrema bivittatum TaxID=194408 RepID=UPI00112C3628|nr:TIR domain-containing adapter molecule 1 [Rhinatrema bivittatum]
MYDKMAEHFAVHRSYEDIYNILSKTSREKLLGLKNKLNCMRSSLKGAKLLQVMILHTLGRQEEAQMAVTTLEIEQDILHIAQKIQNSEPHQHYSSNSLAPQQDPDTLVIMEQIYTLLVNEKLCVASARDQAYQVAIEACKSSDKISLHNVLSESQEYGPYSFNSAELDAPLTLASIPNTGTQTAPLLIPSNRRDEKSIPTALGSLHPFSSMASFSSNLEISQSPTVEYFSRCAHHNNNTIEKSKLCQDIMSSPIQLSEGKVQDANEEDEVVGKPHSPSVHGQPKRQEPEILGSSPSTAPGPETSVFPQTSNHLPIECTDITRTSLLVMPKDELEKGKVQRTAKASVGVSSNTVTTQRCPYSTVSPVEEMTALQQDADSKPNSSATLPLTEIDSNERTFFSFVILHAKGDEAIASKVRDTLGGLGILDGTTYCEEFEIPGHSPLTCIEDAVDNCAFIILLLTNRFVSRWALLQTNTVLMNSINKDHKFNSVIPFLPREDPLQEIPMVLDSIVPLNEKLPSFSRTVQKTFKPERIQKMKEIWKQEEKVRELKRRRKVTAKQVKYNQKINDATLALWMQQQKLHQMMPYMHLNALPFHLLQPQQLFPPGTQPMQQTPGTASCSSLDDSQTFPSVGPVPPQMVYMSHLGGMPFQPGYMQHFPDAQGTQYASGGTQQVIQIQHARNVQIGDHNQMRIVGTEEEKDSTNEVDHKSD